MGIYIKGMKRPKSCGICGWYSFIEQVCRLSGVKIPSTDDVYLSRHEDCPIVEIEDAPTIIEAEEE